ELPANAPLGEHLMRVRGGDVTFSGDLNDPCSVMEYGSTHDYSVRIIDSSLSIDDFLLNDARLEIAEQGDGVYRVFLETDFDRPLRVTVHNLLGQKMIENQVESTGRGYLYEFNMSYAATGVYLLRIGTREVGKVKRFLVK
ncbi:MAG TPA: T9SS type A sorting domain-containing protein, partial [Gillisia sp.]|nr:T9SS type A sorting domain-containing protein [Gillisia sp.]